ncbi:hypothetical protein ACLKA6_012885 [Drosophila palustris]
MSNQNNAELAPYSRNVARRGHPFAVGRDLDRASSKAKQQQTIQTKRCQLAEIDAQSPFPSLLLNHDDFPLN